MDIKKKQQQLKELAASLKGFSDAELEAREQEIIKKADENDAVVAKKEFKLPTENYKVVADYEAGAIIRVGIGQLDN